TLAALIYVGIFPSVIATIFWNGAVAQVGAGTAGVFTNLIPVFSLILAVSLLSESINPFQLVRMNLIFTAIWLVSRLATSSVSVSLATNVRGGVDDRVTEQTLKQVTERAMPA